MGLIAPDEEWRPVPGYEQTYAVSSYGRVWSAPRPRTAGGVLRLRIDNYGYPRVTLVQDGAQRTRRVHVLVMLAFAGECPVGMEVRHLNGDKTDARFVNLSYGSHSENMHDITAHGRGHHAKTHCPQGHAYDEANTTVSGGRRYCRACKRERWS